MHKIRSLLKSNPISEGMRTLADTNLFDKSAEILPFPTVVTGGKDGGDTWWLMGLDTGTIFLARPKNDKQNFVCMEFALFEKYDKCALLFTNQPEGSRPLHVDMRRFSIQYELVEIIKKVPREEFDKEDQKEVIIEGLSNGVLE